MTAFADQFADSFAGLLVDFGEAVAYRSHGNPDEREINAIVDRKPGEAFSASGDVVTYSMMIRVHNDSTLGISASELEEGRDLMEVPRRTGGVRKTVIIDQLINADAGVLVLRIA